MTTEVGVAGILSRLRGEHDVVALIHGLGELVNRPGELQPIQRRIDPLIDALPADTVLTRVGLASLGLTDQRELAYLLLRLWARTRPDGGAIEASSSLGRVLGQAAERFRDAQEPLPWLEAPGFTAPVSLTDRSPTERRIAVNGLPDDVALADLRSFSPVELSVDAAGVRLTGRVTVPGEGKGRVTLEFREDKSGTWLVGGVSLPELSRSLRQGIQQGLRQLGGTSDAFVDDLRLQLAHEMGAPMPASKRPARARGALRRLARALVAVESRASRAAKTGGPAYDNERVRELLRRFAAGELDAVARGVEKVEVNELAQQVGRSTRVPLHSAEAFAEFMAGGLDELHRDSNRRGSAALRIDPILEALPAGMFLSARGAEDLGLDRGETAYLLLRQWMRAQPELWRTAFARQPPTVSAALAQAVDLARSREGAIIPEWLDAATPLTRVNRPQPRCRLRTSSDGERSTDRLFGYSAGHFHIIGHSSGGPMGYGEERHWDTLHVLVDAQSRDGRPTTVELELIKGLHFGETPLTDMPRSLLLIARQAYADFLASTELTRKLFPKLPFDSTLDDNARDSIAAIDRALAVRPPMAIEEAEVFAKVTAIASGTADTPAAT
jgi:hypothetical protein